MPRVKIRANEASGQLCISARVKLTSHEQLQVGEKEVILRRAVSKAALVQRCDSVTN